MLNQLIKFSLTQRLFVSIFVIVAMAIGAKSWLSIPVDAFPEISPTQVKIVYKLPGMNALEIESQVTRVIETELLGIPSQQMLRSTTLPLSILLLILPLTLKRAPTFIGRVSK